MSVLDNPALSVAQKEKITEISHVFLLLFETYTNKRSVNIKFQDSTHILFDGDKFVFGRFVLQLLSVFSIQATFVPLREFQEFPTVADIILHIFYALTV